MPQICHFTLSNTNISSSKLDIVEGSNVTGLTNELSNSDLFNVQQEFLNIFLHTSDISNPTKPWIVYQTWADRVMKEFWAQGDEERKLGIPISFLCDRKTTKIPNAQIGFIDGIVLPLLTTFVSYFPGLNFLLLNSKQNREIFVKQKEQAEILEKAISG